ncbi:hypothetical protein [Terribacillus saccharophilus]|uniref:Uncharacterized protein n=1 Tax=Terribacillus saccharophilus TaxID=361277 RepID=A0A268A6X6_9BACI|nr:hypothetical protein [Terribacillus saccharophilus]PAD19864.1 hypothetical protein CHH64_16870 [Terribacillus saccharophilus]
MKLWQIPSFLIGSIILFLLIAGSIVYSSFYHSYIPQTSFAYNDAGELQGPPFAPLEFSFLGIMDAAAGYYCDNHFFSVVNPWSAEILPIKINASLFRTAFILIGYANLG